MAINVINIMKAKSIKGNTPEEIHTAVIDSKNNGFTPTLAFVFITNTANAIPLGEMFESEGIAVFGVSTPNKFNEQGMEPDDIVALLLDINTSFFKIVLQDFNASSPYEAARQTGTIEWMHFIIRGSSFRLLI